MDKYLSTKTKEKVDRLKEYEKEYFSKELLISSILLNIYVVISIVHLANHNFSWIYVLILFMFSVILVFIFVMYRLNKNYNLKPNKEKTINGFILFSNTVRLLMLSTNLAFVFTLEMDLNVFEHIIKFITIIYLIYSLIAFIKSYRRFKLKNSKYN